MSRTAVLLFCFLVLLPITLIADDNEHVFQIQARGVAGSSRGRVLTGFRVSGSRGIITALHGVLGAGAISAENRKMKYGGLTIRAVDVEHDLALLMSPQIEREPTMPGFSVGAVPPPYSRVALLGYPLGIQQLETIAALRDPATRVLAELLPPGPTLAGFGQRNSPGVRIQVVSIQGTILRGLSGAPVLQGSTVVGVCDGGLLDGFSQIVWAIPPTPSWKSPDTIPETLVDEAAESLFSDLANLPPVLPFRDKRIDADDVLGEARRAETTASVDEDGRIVVRTTIETRRAVDTFCITPFVVFFDESDQRLHTVGNGARVCVKGKNEEGPASALSQVIDTIPPDKLAAVRRVAIVHEPTERDIATVLQENGPERRVILRRAMAVETIPQKILVQRDLALQADGCRQESRHFTAVAPGDVDLTRGGAFGAPRGFDFDIRGNNIREVHNARATTARSIEFDAVTQGKGTNVAGLCVGAEGANISVDVYAWIKTTPTPPRD